MANFASAPKSSHLDFSTLSLEFTKPIKGSTISFDSGYTLTDMVRRPGGEELPGSATTVSKYPNRNA